MHKPQQDSDIFFNNIRSLINNLLINNVNYSNNYYLNDFGFSTYKKVIFDTQKRAKYILERMESNKHLIEVSKQ